MTDRRNPSLRITVHGRATPNPDADLLAQIVILLGRQLAIDANSSTLSDDREDAHGQDHPEPPPGRSRHQTP